MDVRPRLARPPDRFRRLARADRADRASLHAGGSAARPVVPRLRAPNWSAWRRRWRFRFSPSAARSAARIFWKAGARSPVSVSVISIATSCRRCCAKALTHDRCPTRHRLSRRRPHGPRHRGGVRLCRPRRHHGRRQGALEPSSSRSSKPRRSARSARRWRAWRGSDCSTAATPMPSLRARLRGAGARHGCRAGRRGHRLRGRARSGRPQARGAGARPRKCVGPDIDHRLDHVDHPGRRPLRRGRTSRALSQRALAQPGLSDSAGRDLAGRCDRSRRHRAREGPARRHRQGAGGVRGDARLHRAADPGARDERGGADGGGRRRQRRGHRQGDPLRLRLPLRGAGPAGIHRLGRRRHSLLRQPLPRRRAAQRPLPRARRDRRPTCATAASACAPAPAFSTIPGSTSMPIARSG